MLETIHQDYVRTARAKGLSERLVVLRHAFRNAAIPAGDADGARSALPLHRRALHRGDLLLARHGPPLLSAAERRDYGC